MKHWGIRVRLGTLVLGLLAGVGCDRSKQSEAEPEVQAGDQAVRAAQAPAADRAAAAEAAEVKSKAAEPQKAAIGKPAPGFTLTDLEGNEVSLSQFSGKTVVLEWFNPECPFVKAAHDSGPLKDLAARTTAAPNVAWLAVNSGAPGKQGHGVEVNQTAAKTWAMAHPILLDETGAVGHAYGATNTPHMFVIDAEGTLVYRGALDNAPMGEPDGGARVAYFEDALAAVQGGTAVSSAETRAWGCSVKYAK